MKKLGFRIVLVKSADIVEIGKAIQTSGRGSVERIDTKTTRGWWISAGKRLG